MMEKLKLTSQKQLGAVMNRFDLQEILNKRGRV